MGIYESFLSHMGGEHFVVLLNLEDYERFCKALAESFDQQVRQLYTRDEANEGYITAIDKKGTEGRYPLMRLSIGVAHNGDRDYKSAKKMFETLAQLRQAAKPVDKSLFFVDRRHSDR